MKDFELKVGDLVKLRDDLVEGKEYGCNYYVKNMNFKEFKKIEEVQSSGEGKIRNNNINYYYTKEMIAEVKRPIEYETIYKREEPILDYKEKEYLGNVIRPFRDRVKYIVKLDCFRKEYISLQIYNDFGDIDSIDFPYFKKDTMYKNMKVDKEYTLEELGL